MIVVDIVQFICLILIVYMLVKVVVLQNGTNEKFRTAIHDMTDLMREMLARIEDLGGTDES